MEKKYTYKLQGDGRDSWRCDEIENGIVLNSYMVFESPNKEQLPITEEQLINIVAKAKELGLL